MPKEACKVYEYGCMKSALGRLCAPAGVTVTGIVAVCWIPPPLPVTVTGYVPAVTLLFTVIVITELPLPGAASVPGAKLAVTPEGMPEADRLIALLNPPLIALLIEEGAWLPCTMLSEGGPAESIKLGCPAKETVSVKITVCLIPPPVAVIVMG